jgi:uncharacterized membrane protein
MNKNLLIIGMLLVLVVFAVSAATPMHTPSSFSGQPGEVMDGNINITNDSGEDLYNISFGISSDLSGLLSQTVDGPTTLLDGISANTDYSFTIPTDATAGNYKITIITQAETLNGSVYAGFDDLEIALTVEESETKEISVTESTTIEVHPGESSNETITVTNTGNVDLTDITIAYDMADFEDHGNNQMTVVFSEDTFDLEAGNSIDIIVTANAHEYQYFYPERDSDYDGTITVSNSEVSTSLNLEVEMKMIAFTKVTIENLDDLEELSPGEEFDVEIEFDDAKFDTEDIDVEMTIYDFDEGDNLDEDSEKFDIDDNNDYDLDFNLEVPLDVNDAKYNVLLDIDGNSDDDDYNNFRYYVYYEDAIDIEKDESYDAGFNFVRFEPETPLCGGSVTITTEVINTGRNKLNEMYLKLKIDDLEISERSESFDLKETEGKRDEKVEFFVNLPENMEAKEYDLEIMAYDEDNDIVGSEVIRFTPTGTCTQSEDAEETDSTEDSSNEESDEETTGTVFLPTGWSVGNFFDDETAKTTFWVIGDLTLIVIIIYFLSLFFKKRK